MPDCKLGRVVRRSDGCVPSLLLHPLPLAAIALTALNDHLLKGSGALPGWLTGKLSDFAGLFFFPIAVVAAWRAPRAGGGRAWTRRCRRSRRRPRCVHRPVQVVAVGVRAASGDDRSRRERPAGAADVAARVLVDGGARPGAAARTAPWARLAALGAAALTASATSPGPLYYRPLPIWSVVPPAPGALACARPELWVSKSGREGVGLTLAVHAPQAACTVRIERVTFVLPGAGSFVAAGFPEELTVPPGQVIHRYVPIAFDNGAAWRKRLVNARVELQVIDPRGAQALRFDLVQRQPTQPSWGTSGSNGSLPATLRGRAQLLITETGRKAFTSSFACRPPRRGRCTWDRCDWCTPRRPSRSRPDRSSWRCQPARRSTCRFSFRSTPNTPRSLLSGGNHRGDGGAR